MSNAQGFNESVWAGPEDTFKTTATHNGTKLPVINPSFKPTVTRFTSEALGGSAQPRVPVDGKIAIDGTFDLEVSRSSLGLPLKGVFGSVSNQGLAGNYDHVFSLGTLGSWWIEQRFTDISRYFVYSGCRFDKASFDFAPEGLMKASVSLMGAKTVIQNSTVVDGTTTDKTTDQPLSYLGAAVKFAGSTIAYATDVKVDLDRQVEKVMAIDGTNELADIISKIAVVKGTMKVFVQDEVIFMDAINSTEVSIELFCADANNLGHGIWFVLPTCKLMPAGPTTNGPGGLVTGEFSFDAYGAAATSLFKGFIGTKGFSTVTITGATNDVLIFNFDGGADKSVTLTAGSRTPAQIASDLNGDVDFNTSATAFVQGSRVICQLSAGGAAHSITVKTAGSTAAATLGLVTGTPYSGLDNQAIVAVLTNVDATV